jgi:hypothetical protein
MKHRVAFLLFTGALIAACSSACSSSTSGTTNEADAGSTADDAKVTTSADGLVAIQQALGVADNLFRFDPDIVPGRTPDQNGTALDSTTRASTASCPSAKVTYTAATHTLTADFGPPPGCQLATGTWVSGSLAASVGTAPGDGGDLGGPATVTLTFTKLVANAIALDGTIAFTTVTAGTYTVEMTALSTSLASTALTLDGKLTLVGATGYATLSGNLNVSGLALQLQDVELPKNACYPDKGTVAVTTLLTKYTFDANTPTTGKVQKQIANLTPTTFTLRAYGSCPPGPPGPGDAG